MKYLVTYDPVTKKITGRVKLSDPSHAANYLNSVEITEEEFNAEPEKHRVLDKNMRRLRALYDYEGLKVEDLPTV